MSPLLAKGHSVKVILANHPEIGMSPTTLYRYIDFGVLGSAKNIDLPRKVRFKKRARSSPASEPARDLAGRDYAAFLGLPQEYRDAAKECDTVIGRVGGKCLLAFVMRDVRVFYARLIDRKTAFCVKGAFDDVEMMVVDALLVGELGPMVLLTDRGGEFCRFEELEEGCFAPGAREKRLSMYYCNPYHSWEKPAIENAHTLLRRVLPKGTSFDGLAQADVDLVCSHINSYPREDLGWRAPFELLPEWGRENLPKAFGMEEIPRDEVNLTPSLIGR